MPTGGQRTLLTYRGIRIGVDWSWFVVLFLVIIWLSGFYRGVLDASDSAVEPYALAVASALLFFGSILLHELGHAVVALRNGIGITEITLWMFGGVARMQRDTTSAGIEFRIATAGPLVTLLIAIACAAIGTAIGGEDFSQAMVVDEDADTSGVLALLAWLASINALILVFNLLPAYPLDGGRIARSIAWALTGDRAKATRVAATLGTGFSWFFIGAGVLLAVAGQVFTGIWLALIGFILGSSARSALVGSEMASRLAGMKVADVMDTEPVAVPESLAVERVLDEYFLRYRWPWFPVVDDEQRFVGLVERGAADGVPVDRRDHASVSEILSADPEGTMRVDWDEPVDSLLSNEALRRLGALVAVDRHGRLQGIVTLHAVSRALQNAGSGPG